MAESREGIVICLQCELLSWMFKCTGDREAGLDNARGAEVSVVTVRDSMHQRAHLSEIAGYN